MRKVLLIIASIFAVTCANASNVEKIQFANAGSFSLGIMAGTPASLGWGPNKSANAKTPMFSVDAMIGLKDGFIHTNKFGDNGAIDLGLFLGYCLYGIDFEGITTNAEMSSKWWRLPIAARCGFNWEFVKNLDVYAGVQGGVAIYHSTTTSKSKNFESKVSDSDTDGILGLYSGAKWMFSDFFGVKVDFSKDWLGDGDDVPNMSAGIQLNF